MSSQPANHRSSQQNLWDRIWKDRHGQVVVWQNPNAWLIGWAVLTVMSLLVSGTLADVFSWLATASLIVWSLQEIFRGVNYFRQALGILVLAFSIASIINLV